MNRTISIFMALVILFSCFTFVKPVRAATTYDNIVYESSEHSVTVDWSNSDSVLDYKFSSFTVTLSDIDENVIDSEVLDGSITYHTFTGLSGGTSYRVNIKGVMTYDSGDVNDDYYIGVVSVATTPSKVTGLKQTKWWLWANSCDIEWNKQNACSYEIQVVDIKGKTVAHEKNYYSNSYSFPVSNNKVYKVKVRACSLDEDMKLTGKYGQWSKTAYCLTQPMISKASYTKKGAVYLTFNKISGATEYDVYVSNKEKKGYKKCKTLAGKKNTTICIGHDNKKHKFKKNKKYYFYIVAKKKVNGKKYTSGRHYTTTLYKGNLQTNWTFD